MAFLREWAKALVWADSLAGRLGKIATIVLLALGVPKVFDQPLYLFLSVPDWGMAIWRQNWTIGWALLGVSATIYCAWAGGAAWIRSRGPVLWVDKNISEERQPGRAPMFLLLVGNHGESILEPDARLQWVEKIDGTRFSPGVGSLPLRWFAYERGERPRLSWRQTHALQVAFRSFLGGGLMFTVDSDEMLQTPNGEDVRICVRVMVPGTKKMIERQFTARFGGKGITWTLNE